MPIHALTSGLLFPDPSLAEPDGLLAVGGDLSPARVLAAYALGIFPWYSEGEPLLWWSPDPRLLLHPRRLHVSRSLRRTVSRGGLTVTADADFHGVITACARRRRRRQRGTWITDDMREAYVRLHRLGFAHSVEAWSGGRLAGGLYGVSLGGAFFGESMFHAVPDASKVALLRLCEVLASWDFDFVDCQVRTDHLVRLGAEEVPRDDFLAALARSLERPTRRGSWTRDFAEAVPSHPGGSAGGGAGGVEPTAGFEPATC